MNLEIKFGRGVAIGLTLQGRVQNNDHGIK